MLARRQTRCPTFTVGFAARRFDESEHAANIASTLGLRHQRIACPEIDVDGLVDDFIDCYEQPYADTSGLPTILLCRQAKRYVTVALSGDGGDEFFGGYERYRWYARLLAMQRTPSTLRRWMGRVAGRTLPDRAARIQRIFSARDDCELYAELIRAWTAGPTSAILPDIVSPHAPHEFVRSAFAEIHGDALTKAMYFDTKFYLPDDLQVKIDRASMRVGLEVRCPLMDPSFCHIGATLDANVKMRHGLKSVLRRMLGQFVEPALFQRPKRGFTAPLASWLAGPLANRVHETLIQRRFRECGWVNHQVVEDLWTGFQNGDARLAGCIWMLFMLASHGLAQNQTATRRWPSQEPLRVTSGAA